MSRIALPDPREAAKSGSTPSASSGRGGWHLYSPMWARVAVEGGGDSEVVALQDRDPCDYARATRLFPRASTVQVAFDLCIDRSGREPLLVELLAERGARVRCLTLPV